MNGTSNLPHRLNNHLSSLLCCSRESNFLVIFSNASSKKVFFTLFNPVQFARWNTKYFLRYWSFTIFANLKLNFFLCYNHESALFVQQSTQKMHFLSSNHDNRFLHNPKKTNVAQVCVTSSIFSMFKMFFCFCTCLMVCYSGWLICARFRAVKTVFLHTVDVNVS